MGSSYQTILAVGTLEQVRAAVTESGQTAAVIPVGDARWAVIPQDDDGYAETRDLAGLLSRGTVAASFDVFDSDVMAIAIYSDGRSTHDYLSEQSFADVTQDADDNEIRVDFLGREYPAEATLPTGPYGADPAAFAPLAAGPLDKAALAEALSAENLPAEDQHHKILHALGVTPKPLQLTYADAVVSGLGA